VDDMSVRLPVCGDHPTAGLPAWSSLIIASKEGTQRRHDLPPSDIGDAPNGAWVDMVDGLPGASGAGDHEPLRIRHHLESGSPIRSAPMNSRRCRTLRCLTCSDASGPSPATVPIIASFSPCARDTSLGSSLKQPSITLSRTDGGFQNPAIMSGS
jgi:hypothetical protein